MFHPVGSQPPAVYWRRRLLMMAALVLVLVLLVLTANAVLGGGGGATPAAAGPQTDAAKPASGHGHQTTTPAERTSGVADQTRTGSPAPAGTGKPSGSKSGAAAPATCTAKQLSVKAVVGKTRYAIGDQPVLTLQVTNTGPAACVQNVADSQIVLRVYNGASRVWGSHDCQIEPGTDERTLEVGKPAGFSIVWSGLTSQPKCAGIRQRVGAGTYTLYASLSGHDGKATQFVIS
jgi:hypothetical protein